MGKSAQGRQRRKRSVPGTPDTKKRKRGTNNEGAGLCDDVVGDILARLPARAAVACTALSKRHRRLIRSPEFRSLHCRLAPPLPRPHIAYLATAPIRRRPDQEPISGFVGFHVAGAGLSGITPMRSLAGRRFLGMSYVNTCNGVVLLAPDGYTARCRCILWNPAVADVVEEVAVPDPSGTSRYLVLGLSYGQRSKTYKLLLCRREDGKDGTEYSLETYTLGVVEKKVTELLPGGRDGDFGQEDSVCIDGKIYLLNRENAIILAFDVDEEGVTSIVVPVKHHHLDRNIYVVSKLMEMSGRPCVVADHGRDCALWVLSGDHQWEQRFLIRELQDPNRVYLGSIKGVWDCGSVLVLCCLDYTMNNAHDLFLYDVTIQTMFKAKMHQDLAPPKWSKFLDYALCWGYKPTLVSPSSIVSKPNQDKERCRECSTDIMKALKPVAEQDRRKGQEVTLGITCFMDFLVRIMHKLPKELQLVLEMTMVDSDDPDFSFENVPFAD